MGEKSISMRRKKLIENFMVDHDDGLSIAEIADKYHVSKTTVYASLQEIADKHGVTRESLLEKIIVRGNDSCYSRQYCKVEVKQIEGEIMKMLDSSKAIVTQIDTIMLALEEEH